MGSGQDRSAGSADILCAVCEDSGASVGCVMMIFGIVRTGGDASSLFGHTGRVLVDWGWKDDGASRGQ